MTSATLCSDCGNKPSWARGLCNTCYRRYRYRLQAYGKWDPLELVSAVGTVRRLRALCALGWPYRVLAPMLGFTNSKSQLPELIAGRKSQVRADTHRRVAELFDRLQMTPGPSVRSRQRAAAKGWAPPMAWDEEAIDDPKAKPAKASRRKGTAAERISELYELGIRDVDAIAETLQVKPKSVVRQLHRMREAS